MNKIACTYRGEITCPWCGYEYENSFEFENYDELDCANCEKPFSYERDMVYSSDKIEDEDGE